MIVDVIEIIFFVEVLKQLLCLLVIVIWECELKPDKREKTLASLAFTLNHIFLQDHSIAYPHAEEENEFDIAAEPLADK